MYYIHLVEKSGEAEEGRIASKNKIAAVLMKGRLVFYSPFSMRVEIVLAYPRSFFYVELIIVMKK